MRTFICLLGLALAQMALAEKPHCTGTAHPSPFNCVVITYPAPQGGTIDLADWMQVDSTLRGTFYFSDGIVTDFALPGKIVYTKFNLVGDSADVWTYDEDYVYGYATYGPPNGSTRGTRAVPADSIRCSRDFPTSAIPAFASSSRAQAGRRSRTVQWGR